MDAQRWQQIQRTFDLLVQLDVVERGNRLTAIASTDPELRAAVDALLAADNDADARLEPLESAVRQPASVADPLGLAGRTISHFEVREPIGAGGMGVVYRAEDTDLGRAVALKFLTPAYSLDAAAKARFLREAYSTAALNHPNLCTIHEVGTSDDGRLFLAMAVYEGETLSARLARDFAMPQCEALEIARQIAEGLQAAHVAGIVHRDLKPGNVMLLPDGRVKILDFGLAKIRDQSFTETGAVFGTVAYMAPEQIRGASVDGRADLWSLGVVLYEMLTERKPFESDNDIAIAHAILHDEPVSPVRHRGDVSPALEDLVLRLLEKNPDRRYPTAAALLSSLAIAGAATTGARDALRRHLRRIRHRFSRNRRRMLTSATAIVLTAGATYAVTTRKSATATAVPLRMAIAVLPFRNLGIGGSDAYVATGLHEEILSQLHKITGIKVIGRNSVMGYGRPNAPPLREIASELGVGSLVEASVQVIEKRLRVDVRLVDAPTGAPLWAERYDRPLEDAFALQSDIAQQIVAAVGAVLSGGQRAALARVPTTRAQAYLLYLKAREYDRRSMGIPWIIDSAMAFYEQALALDPNFALAHAALSRDHGEFYWRRYDMTPARLARQRAHAETALRLAPDLPQAHQSMSAVHNTGPEPNRQEYLREVRAALRGAPNDPQIWRGMAEAHRRRGNWDGYVAAFEKAVELDPRDAGALFDGGETLERMGRYAEAIHLYNRVRSIDPDQLYPEVRKGWAYASWQRQLDSLRTAMGGPPGQMLIRNGWIYDICRFLLIERQADSLLRLLKWAHEEAPHVPVIQGALFFHPNTLYAAWAHQLRRDHVAARAAFDSALVLIDSAMALFPEDRRTGIASIPSYPVHEARGMALAGLGQRAEALAEVRALRGSAVYRNDHFLGPYVKIGVAQILAHAGEADASMDELERLLSDPAPALTVHTLRMEPVWDPIREHPRFRALLAKYQR
jgi:TolB-like protein